MSNRFSGIQKKKSSKKKNVIDSNESKKKLLVELDKQNLKPGKIEYPGIIQNLVQPAKLTL